MIFKISKLFRIITVKGFIKDIDYVYIDYVFTYYAHTDYAYFKGNFLEAHFYLKL